MWFFVVVFRASPKTDFALPDLRTRTWKNRSIVLVGEDDEIAVVLYGSTDSRAENRTGVMESAKIVF